MVQSQVSQFMETGQGSFFSHSMMPSFWPNQCLLIRSMHGWGLQYDGLHSDSKELHCDTLMKSASVKSSDNVLHLWQVQMANANDNCKLEEIQHGATLKNMTTQATCPPKGNKSPPEIYYVQKIREGCFFLSTPRGDKVSDHGEKYSFFFFHHSYWTKQVLCNKLLLHKTAFVQ